MRVSLRVLSISGVLFRKSPSALLYAFRLSQTLVKSPIFHYSALISPSRATMSGVNPFSAVFSHYNFQLAILEPSTSPTSTIKVTLSYENRTDTSYECISYDRSKESTSIKIQLNDEEVEIPSPLETALRALRKPDQSRLLWADVLLGRSMEEQNAQAALAKTILQNAKSTVVWLGPGHDRTEDAIKVIKTLAIWWHQAAVRSNFPSNFAKATAKNMQEMMMFFVNQDPAQLRPDDSTLWDAMLKIFQSQYFESVQSIPDLVLSEDVIVTVGASSISWADFTAAFRGLVVAMPRLLGKTLSQELQNSFERISGIEMADRRFREDDGLELLPMIQTARDMQCSDPREYIFAMLPIVRQSKRAQFTGKKVPMPEVDYNKTPQEVFSETAAFVIEERQDLLLWWAERPPNARRIEGLPSWVPDWTVPLPSSVVKITPESKVSLRQWSDTVSTAKPIKVIDNKLHVQAHKLDRIASVSKIFTDENCRRLLLEVWQALPNNPNQTLTQKVDMFWRSIVLNIGGETEALKNQAPPPNQLWVSMQSVLAEERILELMKCTPEQLMNDDSIRERARVDPQCQLLGPQVGKSEAFEALLRRNAIGRRFFTTESGRMGMSAFEAIPAGKGESEERAAKVAAALNELPTESNDFGFGDMMINGFQQFLAERSPENATVFAKLMEQKEKVRGVKVGDVIVAAVGGFHPYVLRAVEADGGELVKGKEYKFIGDCYLHGVMSAEPFLVKNWLGISSWKKDVVVEDIRIT